MLYYWLLFFFVAFGAKCILATIMIYLLLPADRECSRCDGETLLLQGGHVSRFTSWFLMHRVQRRWCPGCGWEGLARRIDESGPQHADGTSDVIHPTRHSADR
jgi:hypothetical protein